MKTLVKLNNWALGITLLLYLTLYLGMIAQILLGFIQAASAIAVTIGYYRELSRPLKIKIIIYWIAAALSLFLLWFINSYLDYNYGYAEAITMVFFPMSVAIYFLILLRQISGYHENTSKPHIAL